MLRAAIIAIVLAAAAAAPSAALAHVHSVTTGNGTHQNLANGQNHAPFVNNVSCVVVDPAGYGLETAHHGPDSGTPGAADTCYQRDGAPDDQNPAID